MVSRMGGQLSSVFSKCPLGKWCRGRGAVLWEISTEEQAKNRSARIAAKKAVSGKRILLTYNFEHEKSRSVCMLYPLILSLRQKVANMPFLNDVIILKIVP